MKISVIVPVFNEQENVDLLYEQLCAVLITLPYDYEIIYVDDGSTDQSSCRLDAIAQKNRFVKVIHLQRNFGQTAAMMAAIDFSTGDVIIPMDADLQNDPRDIPQLMSKLTEGYDVCSGWRIQRQDNYVFRKFPSMIANAIISIVSGVHLHDYGCTLKAYKKEIIKDVKLYGEMHRFIPIYAYWQGARITEIPIMHHPRAQGESKYGLNRIFKVILDLIVIKFLTDYSQKPIYIFGGFGLISVFLSMLSFSLMIYFKFWGGKTFIQTPLPLLVIFFLIMGFQSILIGLIAEMMTRTYFESQNKPVYKVKYSINTDI